MRINHNIAAMITQGSLFGSNKALGKDVEKLSTGLRINRASDDAAGLAISESAMRTQVKGKEQAKRNTLDAIGALNIAEGAVNEIHSILQRQREIAIQSSTATYSDSERVYMEQDFKQLNEEIDRIVKATNFNTIKLLDSSVDADKRIFVSTSAADAGNDIWCDANGSVGVDSIGVAYGSISTSSMGLDISNVLSATDAQAAILQIDEAIKAVSELRTDIGAYLNRFESTINNLDVSTVNQQAAETQIRDTDFAYQTSQMTRNQILTQSATAMLSQANGTPQSMLSLF